MTLGEIPIDRWSGEMIGPLSRSRGMMNAPQLAVLSSLVEDVESGACCAVMHFHGANPPEARVNTLLWLIQIVLGIKFLSVAYSHGLRQGQDKMQNGIRRIGPMGRPLLYGIAVCTLLGGIGLILPVAAHVPAGWTPVAAGLLAVLMLLSIAGHIACQDKPKTWVSLILFALAAILAYGRWMLVPLT